MVSASQPPLPVRHSLMSVQPLAPPPVYPAGQPPQVWEPGVLVQVASGSQPPLAVRHSLMSIHIVAPVPE